MEVPGPNAPRFGMLRTSPSRNHSRQRSRSPLNSSTRLPSSRTWEVSDLTTGLSNTSITDTQGVPYTSEYLSQDSQEQLHVQQHQDDDEEEAIPNDPFDKWDEVSLERAMTGDKSSRKVDYR